MNEALRAKIGQAPVLPGVYLFKDARNRIIYIGKASNLKARLASYPGSALLAHAADLDTIVTNSDVEALTLEESLIKLHKPRYNIRLKDDKKFPYLKITIQEDFPRILFTRDLSVDGSLVFGPYTNARALRRTRDALCRIFKLVSCAKDLSKKYARPCLEYHLARCSAPCTAAITKKEYRDLVEKAVAFLRGNSRELEQAIEEQMWQHARAENFEAAKARRDQLFAVRRIAERQQIVTADDISRDVIGIKRGRYHSVACLFRIRENRLVSKETYDLKIDAPSTGEEIASAFIRLIYTHISFVPGQIVIATTPADWDIQRRWFASRGHDVQLTVNPRGKIKELLAWAVKNAESEASGRPPAPRVPAVLLDLQDRLHLPHPPRWIEGFDVSNLGDKFAVGASVAFKDGRPYKQYYRRYRIRRPPGQDDFAMIREIVARRFKDLKERKRRPDLILVDGGKGQLSAARRAIREVRVPVPAFALAKRYDELYDPQGNVISMPAAAQGFYLLKRLRDEAHRFAVGYHRKLRGRALRRSVLDDISGIGPARKREILRYFGSIEALRRAGEEEIARVPGIGPRMARHIYGILHT